MKKTKVENVSDMKLDFFVSQNKEFVRVALKPGESSWCDTGITTKSMILYERKNLIKSSPFTEATIITEVAVNVNNDEALDKLHTTEDIEYVEVFTVDPPEFTPDTTEALTPLEKAEKETEEYKKESEKTYKGKKRGRKKKRGPKPGSKRKKSGDGPAESKPE